MWLRVKASPALILALCQKALAQFPRVGDHTWLYKGRCFLGTFPRVKELEVEILAIS